MTKLNRTLEIAVLLIAFCTGALAQTPQAPASQGNQPSKPGPAQKTAKTPVSPSQVQPWKQIPVPQLPSFKPALPKRVELPNGMVLFLQPDHELPLISVEARIRGGSRLEPATKIGLVDMYGEVWRTGGTKTKTGDQMDDFLEARAAKLETGGGVDSTYLSLDCLKGDFEDVFALFQELLRDPAFREDKLALAKDQMNTGISRRNDDMGEIASREAAFLAYGKSNPYARVPEYATVAAVSREDLVKWHSEFVHPNNILLGIVGDFDPDQMEAKLRSVFESWQKGPAAPKPELKFTPAKPGYYFVQKDDVTQSAIQMVALGIRRDNPEYFAVSVMNEIFGGGMSARLFKNIRTRQGLAYSVGGGIGASYDHPGIFRLAMGTKSASTVDAIKALDEQIKDLLKNPGSAEELKLAKDSILNSFIFSIDSPEKVLGQRMTYEYYGYPLDFLERFRAGVERVTLDDVSRVAQKYVKPGMFAVLVVGNTEADKLLASLGSVRKVDITIPTGTESAPTSATSNPEGEALISKVVEALGGEEKLKSIKALRTKSDTKQETPQGEMTFEVDSLVEFPNRAVQVMTTPMGEFKSVITPQDAFFLMQGQVRSLPAQFRDSALADMKREELFIAQHANDPKFIFVGNGTEKIGNIQTTVLEINADGVKTRWYVDPGTGHVVRQAFDSFGMRGPVERVVDVSGWKNVNGITLPFSRTITDNGERTSTVEIKEYQVNPQIDPKLFEKPADAGEPGGSE